VLSVALQKLFNGEFHPWNEDHVFAALALRIGLEIGKGEASRRLAMEAVRCHMRILIGVVGPLVLTSSPSEPMLAIAAATALNTSAETYQKAIETLLDKLILPGLILGGGLQGELYTRLLLMLACDKALLPHGGRFWENDPDTHVRRVRPVRLSRFLQTLLGEDLGIRDDDVEQTNHCDNLLEDTSEVWINFTHFVQLSTPISEATPSMLLKAWSSGIAFQCAFLQPVIDGLIVAYFGKLDEPFDVSKLFVIPWQTKARETGADLAPNQLTAPFLVDTRGRTKPLHVVILMDLAASSAFGPHCHLSFGRASRPTGKAGSWDGYANANESEGSRYCLNIRGHSFREYPVLKGFETQFDQLIQRSLACAPQEFVPFALKMEQAMDRVKETG
jgi:hypothetical protein